MRLEIKDSILEIVVEYTAGGDLRANSQDVLDLVAAAYALDAAQPAMLQYVAVPEEPFDTFTYVFRTGTRALRQKLIFDQGDPQVLFDASDGFRLSEIEAGHKRMRDVLVAMSPRYNVQSVSVRWL